MKRLVLSPEAASDLDNIWEYPIVEEVRRISEEHSAEFHYDLDAIFADLKRLETERNQLMDHSDCGEERLLPGFALAKANLSSAASGSRFGIPKTGA